MSLDYALVPTRRKSQKGLKTLEAFKKLQLFKPECGIPLTFEQYWDNNKEVFKLCKVTKKEARETFEIDSEAPLFSEAYLYTLFGKEEARTILGLLSNLQKAIAEDLKGSVALSLIGELPMEQRREFFDDDEYLENY